MMDIVCHSCKEPLQAKDVNIAAGIGVCHKCNKAVTFANSDSMWIKPTIQDHHKITVLRNPNEIVVERKWMSAKVYFMLPFAIFWNGFLFVWYGAALSSGNAPWISLLFPLGHVAVGVFISYSILTTFLNKTRIAISRGQLKIQHLPLPWPGGKVLSSSDISQLFVREKIHSGKNSTSTTYSLFVVNAHGKEIELIKSLDTYEEARKMEQEIETALGIADKHIAGEKRIRA